MYNNLPNDNRYTLNIAGIENYETLQMSIPHCWSEPTMGNVLRKELEPPAVQQAAFDDTVSIFKINLIKLNHVLSPISYRI